MAICKDCIHYEVCQYHIDEETNMTVNECSHEFKHKDQYTKLPAFVGQQVWHVRDRYKYEDGRFEIADFVIKEGKVSMLQQKADTSWKIRITENNSVSDFTLDRFNECVFSTEEAAIKEQAKRMKELRLDS